MLKQLKIYFFLYSIIIFVLSLCVYMCIAKEAALFWVLVRACACDNKNANHVVVTPVSIVMLLH